MKTVKLTDREIDLVLECIGTNIETVKRRHPVTGSTADLIQELVEMDMDIREQAFSIKEDHKQAKRALDDTLTKFNRRAQERRTQTVKRNRDSARSETQNHDIWDDTDPRNW
jgi:hypothetical protein